MRLIRLQTRQRRTKGENAGWAENYTEVKKREEAGSWAADFTDAYRRLVGLEIALDRSGMR